MLCKTQRKRQNRPHRSGQVGAAAVTSCSYRACFSRVRKCSSHVSVDPVQRDPERDKSLAFSQNSCEIKTSLSLRFYYTLNYGCVPGLCDRDLEATQSAVSKQLHNMLQKSVLFLFQKWAIIEKRVTVMKEISVPHAKHLPFF